MFLFIFHNSHNFLFFLLFWICQWSKCSFVKYIMFLKRFDAHLLYYAATFSFRIKYICLTINVLVIIIVASECIVNKSDFYFHLTSCWCSFFFLFVLFSRTLQENCKRITYNNLSLWPFTQSVILNLTVNL